MNISILFPVLNEEKRLENGIRGTINYITKENVFEEYEIIICDNGSTDSTREISMTLSKEYPQLHYLHVYEKGVGLAFREGISKSIYDVVGYMDVDLSTDVRHLKDVRRIFESNCDAKIVNGSKTKGKVYGRKLTRKATTKGLNMLLKLFFGTNLSDAICGFKFFDRATVKSLIEKSSSENGWFYIIELLLRAEKEGIKIHEIPVIWTDDANNTKVNVPKLILNYLSNIFRLRFELKK